MKRFTQYLYEYQREKKIRNIGFVKAEQKENSCVLQIQGRGLEVKSDEELKVYLFYEKNSGYEAAYQGAIPKKKPIVNYRLEFTNEDIGNAKALEDILGVLLLDTGGKRFAAVWGENEVDVDGISTEMKTVETMEEVPEVPVLEMEETGSLSGVEEIPVEAESLTEEIPEEVELQEVKNICEKIQRKELARLPRKDWRLANNNFLLHGFYNYHHLLWIEEEGELYIGVPGVRHAREMQAAQAFGFAQFRYASEILQNLEENAEGQREDFGYYCRRIVRNE